MTEIFFTAQQARNNAVDTLFILNEVNAIQNGILTAVGQGLLEATVATSPMTLPNTNGLVAERFYTVWQNSAVSTDTDVRIKQLQMATVISYFQGLSYGIGQRAVTNTFTWHVTW